MSVYTVERLQNEIKTLSERLDHAKAQLHEYKRYVITYEDIRAGVRVSYGFGGEVMTIIEDCGSCLYNIGGVAGNPFAIYASKWRTQQELFDYLKDGHVLVLEKE